jgi:DNA repair protein RecN (Recombination protein N)
MTLVRLQVENLALIEHAELELAPGLNVFTGETGAGKTMLAQAIGLLAGAPPAPGMVGPHRREAYVEAEFAPPDGFFDRELPEAVAALRPEGETSLVIARRIGASGRSRAMLWGRSCARDDLEALGELLLEVSSQHEARRLARPATQLELLDAAAGAGPMLARMAAAWAHLREARTRLQQARDDAAEAERTRDQLEELVERIERAAPEPGEPEALARERERLRHLDELTSAVAGAAALVNPDDGEGALMLTSRASQLVDGAIAYEPGLEPVAAELRDVAVRLQEAAIDLRAQLDGFDADPGRLEQVEARLSLFAELERRFGGSLDEVVVRADEARRTLELLEDDGERLAALEREAAGALEQANAAAVELRALRQQSAAEFAAAVEAELADLGMDGAHIEVQFDEAELGPRGCDRATVLLAANAGLAARPLAEVASGGELSRIALAVRVAARSGGGPGTLLLDEVDAGVGGRTATAVGDKLQRLAGDAQLLCITHLAQIARAADAHFRVDKRASDPAVTAVTRLEGDEVVDEVARMLGGGEGDESARRHAEALLG